MLCGDYAAFCFDFGRLLFKLVFGFVFRGLVCFGYALIGPCWWICVVSPLWHGNRRTFLCLLKRLEYPTWCPRVLVKATASRYVIVSFLVRLWCVVVEVGP